MDLVGQLANAATTAGTMKPLEPKAAKHCYENAIKSLHATTASSAAFAAANSAANDAAKRKKPKSDTEAAKPAAPITKSSTKAHQ